MKMMEEPLAPQGGGVLVEAVAEALVVVVVPVVGRLLCFQATSQHQQQRRLEVCVGQCVCLFLGVFSSSRIAVMCIVLCRAKSTPVAVVTACDRGLAQGSC